MKAEGLLSASLLPWLLAERCRAEEEEEEAAEEAGEAAGVEGFARLQKMLKSFVASS